MCVCGRACVCVIGMAAGSCVYVCVCVLSVSITSVPGILQRHSLSKALLSCILDPQCVCVCVICVCLCTAVQRLPLCNVFLESRCRSGGARVKPRPRRGQLSGSLPVAVTESEKTVFFCQLFCPVHPHMQRRSAASSFLH